MKTCFSAEAKEIKDGEKEGVYWQIIMPLLIDNRDVCSTIDTARFNAYFLS